jgi:hypothetical protein
MRSRAETPGRSAARTREEFYAMPKVSTYLPLTFEPGKQRWTNFVVECGRCKTDVGDEDTRGYAVPLSGAPGTYRDAPTVVAYHVTAQALCPRCSLLKTADYVLRDDMTLTGFDPGGSGKEGTWGMRKLTLWERIVDRLRLAWPT